MSRMARTAWLLVLHVALVSLAASGFTLISWLWTSDRHFSFEFFRYASRGGWGAPYVSDYTLWQVLTYVAGYGIGLVAYRQLRPLRQRLIVGAGTLLCLLGAGSFAFELTHWLFAFHHSLIVNAPLPAVVVGVLGIVQLGRGMARHQQPALAPAQPA